MPQFFLQHEHLDAEQPACPIHDPDGTRIKMVSDREYTARFENIEVRALAECTRRHSEPARPGALQVTWNGVPVAVPPATADRPLRLSVPRALLRDGENRIAHGADP